MKDLEDFFPHVKHIVPGCAEPTIIQALREACIEFCQRTKLWRSDDEFAVSADNCDVVCVPSGATLYEIEHVMFDGFPLEPASINMLDRDHPYWRTQAEEQCTYPRYFTQIDIDTIRVVPSATGTVKVYTVLMPSQDAEMVPDWMVDKYSRVIAAGALKDLLAIPGQPFFNAELSGAYSARFYSALDANGSMNVRGQQRAPLRTRAQFL